MKSRRFWTIQVSHWLSLSRSNSSCQISFPFLDSLFPFRVTLFVSAENGRTHFRLSFIMYWLGSKFHAISFGSWPPLAHTDVSIQIYSYGYTQVWCFCSVSVHFTKESVRQWYICCSALRCQIKLDNIMLRERTVCAHLKQNHGIRIFILNYLNVINKGIRYWLYLLGVKFMQFGTCISQRIHSELINLIIHHLGARFSYLYSFCVSIFRGVWPTLVLMHYLFHIVWPCQVSRLLAVVL